MQVKVMANILAKNDHIAAAVNKQLSAQGIFVLNLLGSPGSGKTTLLEQTLANLKQDIKCAVIEGDLFTAKDADRIKKYGVPVVQINTSGGCHLDAAMVQKVLADLDTSGLELLIIENVGNLVCPAEFNIGEHAKIAVLSVAEGDDKPLKYPLVFKQSSAVIITKIDLLAYTSFNIETAMEDISSINPQTAIFSVSARTGQGLEWWYEWLRRQVEEQKIRSRINA